MKSKRYKGIKASYRESLESLANVKKLFPREQQIYFIKKFDEDTYKISLMKSVKERGQEGETLEQQAFREEVEFWEKVEAIFEPEENVSRETLGKMEESVSRTKRILYEYAMCNKWEWFVTLTLDAEKVDRYNLKEVADKFSKMMVKINSSVTGEEWGRQQKVEYVLIPEMHKDGAFHFHGFIKGLHKSDVVMNEHNHPDWKQWRENFGYCNMQKIRDKKACAAYATKYITKDLRATIKEKGAHMFYASHGLKKAELIFRGHGQYLGEFDYIREDGFCAVATVTRQQLHDNFVGEYGECIE